MYLQSEAISFTLQNQINPQVIELSFLLFKGMNTIKFKGSLPLVHVGSRKYLLPNEILHLESDLNYTQILLTSGKKILSSTTLKTIESRLLPFKNFVRINRQSIVNLDLVEKIEDQTLFLPGERKIIFSRRREKAWRNSWI
jgi:DNA-binding LytR/AlgR family response regulator